VELAAVASAFDRLQGYPVMLLLKLILAPLLVATATLMARKWGAKIGGLLMGLPLTTGPIFLFLAMDQGPRFAAKASVGILFGLIGLAAFALAYAVSSNKFGWAGCLAFAVAAFLAFAVAARWLVSNVVVAALAACVALLLATSLIRKSNLAATHPPPWWDLWVRMVAVAALTLVITAVAAKLGPVLSGIVGTYPVALTVVVTFTHVQLGRDAVLAMLRGSVLSWFTFASCFLAIGLLIEELGIVVSMSLGVLVAVVTSVLVLWIDRTIALRSIG
jgi:hypothetical protein